MFIDRILSVGELRQEERAGWTRGCPSCARQIRYTVLNLTAGPEPFLYCDQNSDFVLREEDREAVSDLADLGGHASLGRLKAFYEELEANLPQHPSGGRFRIWANIKCPHCAYEFPYAGGQQNEAIRFSDSKVVWIEGATAFRGARLPSSHLVKVIVPSKAD